MLFGLWPAWSAEVLAGGEEPDDLGQEESCREGPSSLEARACEGFGAEDEAEDDVEALNKELADSLVEAMWDDEGISVHEAQASAEDEAEEALPGTQFAVPFSPGARYRRVEAEK